MTVTREVRITIIVGLWMSCTLAAVASAPFEHVQRGVPTVGHVAPPTDPLPINGIAQWNLTLAGVTTNPFEAVNISLNLTPPSGGKQFNAPFAGYYQAEDQWRVRAVLQTAGSYAWSLMVTANGQSLHSSSGTVECSATASAQPYSIGSRGFLRPQFDTPPYRTVYENGDLFAGFGLGDCVGTTLEWGALDADGNKITRNIHQYARDYGEAGWSIFRWSNGNCAFNIYDTFDSEPGHPKGNILNATLCGMVDTLIDSFRTHGWSIWSVPFTFKPAPFPNCTDSNSEEHVAQREALQRYLSFVVARWGSQVDVWSILNEEHASASWLSFAADYVRSIDPYAHPISSSWNDNLELKQIQIDSVHWYSSNDNNALSADTAMAEASRRALSNGKPVYFTESGNGGHNWDPQSHLRMRIRSWVSFFEGVVLMWWNTAGTKNCSPCGGGNMFLGVQEMSYQAILTNFTQHAQHCACALLESVKAYSCYHIRVVLTLTRLIVHRADAGLQNMTVSVDTPSTVRAFGLHQSGGGRSGSGSIQMVYAHHFESHTTPVSVDLTIPQAKIANGGLRDGSTCHAEWLDPETGKTAPATVTSSFGRSSHMTYSSPHFEVDVALVVIC